MEETDDNKTCGCGCETCVGSKHEECNSGMCQWHDKEKADDDAA
jgi:hypothetical protein